MESSPPLLSTLVVIVMLVKVNEPPMLSNLSNVSGAEPVGTNEKVFTCVMVAAEATPLREASNRSVGTNFMGCCVLVVFGVFGCGGE